MSQSFVHEAAANFIIFIIACDGCLFLLSAAVAYVCEFGFETKHRVLSAMFSLMTICWMFSILKDVMIYYELNQTEVVYAYLSQVFGYIARSFSLYSILWYLFFWIKLTEVIFDPLGSNQETRDQKEQKWSAIWAAINFGICALFTSLTIWSQNNDYVYSLVVGVYHIYWGVFVCSACIVGIIYGGRIINRFRALEQKGEKFDVNLERGSLLLVFIGIYGAATLALEIWYAISELYDADESSLVRIFVLPLYDALLEVILIKFFGWEPLHQYVVHRFSARNPEGVNLQNSLEQSPRS